MRVFYLLKGKRQITCLQMKTGQTAYLSCVKDVASREIVAYDLSVSLSMGIVYRTLRKLKRCISRKCTSRGDDSL